MEAISAKLAPLPPSNSRIPALPSVLRPKAKRYFLVFPVDFVVTEEDLDCDA